MAEDVNIKVGADKEGNIKKMQKDLADTEKAAMKAANATEKTGAMAKKSSSEFFSLKGNAKALVGNIASMAGQWSIFAAAVAGTSTMMKALNEDVDRLKHGLTMVGETGLTEMSLKLMEEQGLVQKGILDRAEAYYAKTKGAGLQLLQTDIMRAAEIVGPAAKERNLDIDKMLDAVLDIVLRSKGKQGPVEAAQMVSAMLKTGDVGRLARMGYTGVDVTEMAGLETEERVALTMQKLLPQMQGANLLTRIMTEQTAEAARARAALAEISQANATTEAEEAKAEAEKAKLTEARRYRQAYENYYGLDPASLTQMWLHGHWGEYLAFAERNPESAFVRPLMELTSKLGWYGEYATPLGLLKSKELPRLSIMTTGRPE